MVDDLKSRLDEFNDQLISPQVPKPALPEEISKTPMPEVGGTKNVSSGPLRAPEGDIGKRIEEFNKGLVSQTQERPIGIPERKGWSESPIAMGLGGHFVQGFQTLPKLVQKTADIAGKAIGLEKAPGESIAEKATRVLEPKPEQKAGMEELGKTLPGMIAGGIAEAPGSIAPYMIGGGITHALKIPGLVASILTMAGIGAVSRSDKGAEAVIKGLPEDVIIGGIFHYLGPAFKKILPGGKTAAGEVLAEGGMEVTRAGQTRIVKASVMAAMFGGQSLYETGDIKQAISSGFVGSLLGITSGKGIKKGIYPTKLLSTGERGKLDEEALKKIEVAPGYDEREPGVIPHPSDQIKELPKFWREGEEIRQDEADIPVPMGAILHGMVDEESDSIKAFQINPERGSMILDLKNGNRAEIKQDGKNQLKLVATEGPDGIRHERSNEMTQEEAREFLGFPKREYSSKELNKLNIIIPEKEAASSVQIPIRGTKEDTGKRIDILQEGKEKEIKVKKPKPPGEPSRTLLPETPAPGGKGLDIKIIEDLSRRLTDPKNGGYTIGPDGKDITTGYSVGQGGFDPIDSSPTSLEKHYRENESSYKGLNKGGWRDPETGEVWVEPSKNFNKLSDAMIDGVKKDQFTIYDHQKKDTIKLKEADGKRIFDLDRNGKLTMKTQIKGAEFLAIQDGEPTLNIPPMYLFNDKITGSTFSTNDPSEKSIQTKLDMTVDRFLTPGADIVYKGNPGYKINERVIGETNKWTIYNPGDPGKLIEATADEIKIPNTIGQAVAQINIKTDPKLRAKKAEPKDIARELQESRMETLRSFTKRFSPEGFGESVHSGSEKLFYENNKPYFDKPGGPTRRWYAYAEGQAVEPRFQSYGEPTEVKGKFRIFDERNASPEELKVFNAMRDKLNTEWAKDFGFNKTMPEQAIELDYAAAKGLGYDGLNQGEHVGMFHSLESKRLRAVVQEEGKRTGRNPNGDLSFDGKKIHELNGDQFKAFGDEHGVSNLGPESPSKRVEGEKIPGGLDGRFTMMDLLRMKVEPIDIKRMYEKNEQAVVRLYEKLLKTLTPRLGDNLESLNRLMFGMMSAHTSLLSNETSFRRISPRNIEDVKKLADMLPDNPTEQQRYDVDIKLRKIYALRKKIEGGEREEITTKGVGEGADLSNLSSLAKLWLKDPTWFNKKSTESWETFADRLSSQTRGFGTKTAVFGGVFQSPWEAALGAVDIHISKVLRETLLKDTNVREKFESNIVEKYNTKLQEAKELFRDKKFKEESPEEYEAMLKRLPDPSMPKAKTLDDVMVFANGELLSKRAVIMGYVNDIVQKSMSPRKPGAREGVPESLAGVKFIETPEQFKVMSDAYIASMRALRQHAAELGVKEFPAQWILWDQYRGRFEPHEVMFPGLYKLPKLSLDQSNQAMRINEILGYNQRRGVNEPMIPGMIRPLDVFLRGKPVDYTGNETGGEKITPEISRGFEKIVKELGGPEANYAMRDTLPKDEEVLRSLREGHGMTEDEARGALITGQYSRNSLGALIELGRDAISSSKNVSKEGRLSAIHETMHFLEDVKLMKSEKDALERWIPNEEERSEKIANIIHDDLYGGFKGSLPDPIRTILIKLSNFIKDFGRYLAGKSYGPEGVDKIIRDIETGEIGKRRVREAPLPAGPVPLEIDTARDQIIRARGKDGKIYYSTSGAMDWKEMVNTEVEDRGNYKHKEVEEWKKKYDITDKDRLIWVTPDKRTAFSYTLSSEEVDQGVHERTPESEMDVREYRGGEVIRESDDGDNGFLYIMRGAGEPKLRAVKDAEKEIKDDFRGAIKTIGGAVDGLKRLFAPGARGKSAQRTAVTLGKNVAEMERNLDVYDKGMEKAEDAFDKMTIDQQYAFSQAASSGEKQATPELDTLRKQFKEISDAKAKRINDLDPEEGLVKVRENYWPGADDAAYRAKQGVEQKNLPPTRIFEPTGFIKAKDFQEFNDMLAAGYEPSDPNPVRQFRRKMMEWDKFIYTHEAMQQLERTGDVVKIGTGEKVQPGWEAMPPPYGVTKTGRYVMTDQAAQVFKNWLSRPLASSKYLGDLYRTYMTTSTALQRFQLFGFFHGGFVTAESVISRGALAQKQAYRLLSHPEEIGTFLKTAASVPLAPWSKYKIGREIAKEWAAPGTSTDPRVINAVDNMMRAGGGISQEKMFTNYWTESMKKDFREGKNIKGVIRSPFAAMEIIMKPLMQSYVPSLKLGAFEELSAELQRVKPGLSEEAYNSEMRQIWNRIDDRLGQVRWQRVFMNNSTKNLVQMLIRAPGWTGGTIMEIGGAPIDAFKFIKDWHKTGKMPDTMPDRISYVLSLAVTTMATNAALTCIFAKKKPEELTKEDYFAFQTGDIDERGNPLRGMLPLYSKDVYAYTRAPMSTIWHKTNPIIGLIYELSKNKDYYGTGIIDPTKGQGEKIGEIGKFLAKAFIPFGERGREKISEERGTTVKGTLMPAVGIMPAPSYFSQSKATQKALEFGALKMPEGGRTQEEYERNRLLNSHVKRYLSAAAKGEPVEDVLTKLGDDVRSGKLKQQDVMRFKTKIKGQSLESSVTRLSIDQAMAVWRVATDEEKRKIVPLIFKKFRNLKDPRDKQEYASEIEKISNDLSKIYRIGG